MDGIMKSGADEMPQNVIAAEVRAYDPDTDGRNVRCHVNPEDKLAVDVAWACGEIKYMDVVVDDGRGARSRMRIWCPEQALHVAIRLAARFGCRLTKATGCPAGDNPSCRPANDAAIGEALAGDWGHWRFIPAGDPVG